ncbi:MAG: aminotransferase class V-fold PLP-dependent enzyme [Pseudomonadales bacterium]
MTEINDARRRFLKSGGLALGTAALAANGLASEGEETPAAKLDLHAASWDQVRSQFPLNNEFIHMSGFLLTSYPTSVAKAIEKHRQALDADPATYLLSNEHPAEQAVLAAAAKYINGRPVDIALTQSTTEGLGLLYAGLSIRADQEILTTEHDHYATQTSLAFSAKRSGASIQRIVLYEKPEQASADEMVARIKRAINAKTRIIAITWVHSGTGVKLPIAEISQLVALANKGRVEDDRCLLCVDGVHGFGVEDIDIQAMGCDFFIAGTHKWMFGPRGTGILWGAEHAWPQVSPTIPTFERDAFMMWMKYMPERPLNGALQMTPGGTHAFEHRWAMNEAFNFHLQIGKGRIAQRIHSLNSQLKEGLSGISGVRLHTPQDETISAGIVAFEIDKVDAMQSMEKFREHRIISTQAPYNPSYARLAPGLFNNPEEVDHCLAAIRTLA